MKTTEQEKQNSASIAATKRWKKEKENRNELNNAIEYIIGCVIRGGFSGIFSELQTSDDEYIYAKKISKGNIERSRFLYILYQKINHLQKKQPKKFIELFGQLLSNDFSFFTGLKFISEINCHIDTVRKKTFSSFSYSKFSYSKNVGILLSISIYCDEIGTFTVERFFYDNTHCRYIHEMLRSLKNEDATDYASDLIFDRGALVKVRLSK